MFRSLFLAITLLCLPAYALVGEDITVLPVEQAFSLEANWTDEALELNWHITPGHYLYQSKFNFSSDSIRFEEPSLPLGQSVEDPFLGSVIVHPEDFLIHIPLEVPASNDASLIVYYQGCAATGFCYPPMQAQVLTNGDVILSPEAPQPLTSTSSTNDPFTQTFWMVILSFLGFGLLLSFTPCVLPMLPILYGILCNQQSLSLKKAFALSCTYVLAMASAYAVLGVIAASLGQTLQSAVQTPLIMSLFSALLVLMALMVLEWLPLHLPAFNWVTQCQNRLPKASFLGAAALGALATLVTSPCVTAPLIGALTYIAQTQDKWLGGWALFALGLGMGLPLVMFGTLGGQYLPKAGAWMRHVNALLGFVLLGLALWLMHPFLPATALLWGAAVIALLAALRFQQPLRTLCIIAALIWSAGAWQGKHQLFFFFSAFTTSEGEPLVLNHPVKTLESFQSELKTPAHSLLFVHADWCITCQHIKHQIFTDPSIKAALTNWTVFDLDVTQNTPEQQAFMKHYGIFAPPAILFFGPLGSELREQRIVAETSVGELGGYLEQ